MFSKNAFSSFFKLFAFLAIMCAPIEIFASNVHTSSECFYLAPVQDIPESTFLQDLISKSHNLNETFESIRNSFEENNSLYHQFQFKYPLKNQEHAQIFAKVLQIKAQEAHRFVPVIALSQFISTSHLGFIRRITIDGDGPTVQEHVLVDRSSNAVIFIEEWISTKKGIESGCFAALNNIIEENGLWYFAGTYLYNDKPNQNEIHKRIEMFTKTYENMMIFIENENVEEAYNQLSRF